MCSRTSATNRAATDSSALAKIRFEHLATHTAGFGASSSYSRLQFAAGTKFLYSDGGTNWLGNALTNAFGRDLRTVSQSRLFGPLGLTSSDITWRTPASNFPDKVYGIASSDCNGGMNASVDAMARLGQLFLDGGAWRGQRIVSSSYVARASGPYYPRINVSSLKGHGLLWWNNGNNWQAGVPRDAYWSTGKNNNHTLVVPSLDLVAVRVGTDGWSNHGGKHSQFFKPICDAARG